MDWGKLELVTIDYPVISDRQALQIIQVQRFSGMTNLGSVEIIATGIRVRQVVQNSAGIMIVTDDDSLGWITRASSETSLESDILVAETASLKKYYLKTLARNIQEIAIWKDTVMALSNSGNLLTWDGIALTEIITSIKIDHLCHHGYLLDSTNLYLTKLSDSELSIVVTTSRIGNQVPTISEGWLISYPEVITPGARTVIEKPGVTHQLDHSCRGVIECYRDLFRLKSGQLYSPSQDLSSVKSINKDVTAIRYVKDLEGWLIISAGNLFYLHNPSLKFSLVAKHIQQLAN